MLNVMKKAAIFSFITMLLISLTFAQDKKSSRPAEITWTLKSPPNKPPARYWHAMAYDSARGMTVLFGGMGPKNSLRNDTWEYNGYTWFKNTPAISPPERAFHAMCYDSDRRVVVLFGGEISGNFTNDTWEFDGTSWTEKKPSTKPVARADHFMAYDSQRRVTVLFGGYDGKRENEGLRNDTWEWNGINWIKRNTKTSPDFDINNFGQMAYDSARGKCILGNGWEYDGKNWVGNGISVPSLRSAYGLVYDSAREMLVFYSGWERIPPPHTEITTKVINDTWECTGAWSKKNPSTSPEDRAYFAMVYDSKRQETVLFGGVSPRIENGEERLLNDTWVYGNNTQPGSNKQTPVTAKQDNKKNKPPKQSWKPNTGKSDDSNNPEKIVPKAPLRQPRPDGGNSPQPENNGDTGFPP